MTLGDHFLRVFLWEWETAFPNNGPLPLSSHLRDMISSKESIKQTGYYFTKDLKIYQIFYSVFVIKMVSWYLFWVLL